MEWNSEEEKTKKGMSTSSKVLIAIIACIVLIIVLLIMLLMGVKETKYSIYINGAEKLTITKDSLLTTLNGITYVNIEEFSKLVGYEYHKGEYKAATIDENKCYVEGDEETVSFYLNDSTIYKLPIDERDEQYKEFELENKVEKINDKMYASLDAISKAFNVLLQDNTNEFQIYTLEYLVKIYDANVKEWGYTGIADQGFENQKALLQGRIIVKKDGGLYKIIDTNNSKEIVLDRYTEIEFSEYTQEFFVTDSSKKVGIVNLDGITKIEPAYDSILVLDKESDLYIVEQQKKYGVVSGRGISVIYPEYNSIGLNDSNSVENKYLILNELIPVCKDKKWGAFNKNGSLIFSVIYDGFGYSLTSIEINGVKEVVQPVLEIERANGIVVKKEDKYGLLDVNGRELVPIAVDGIYGISGVEDEDKKYFMLYNGEELNVIDRLVKAGLIEEKVEVEENVDNPVEDINNGIIINNTTNIVENENME